MARIRNSGSTDGMSGYADVERRRSERRTMAEGAPGVVERRTAERRGTADGFEGPGAKASPVALQMPTASAIEPMAGAPVVEPPPMTGDGELEYGELVGDAYRGCLRREAFGSAAAYWNRQLVEQASQGKNPEQLAEWLSSKLLGVEEGRALKLADEVFATTGVDVTDRRTGLHELAVRLLRDEKKAPDAVRAELKTRLAAASEAIREPAVGEQGRAAIIERAYADCLRREPFGSASSYWNAQLVDQQAQGKTTAEIAAWLHDKLSNVEEGRALTLVDQAFAEVTGTDVSNRRTGLHELAVRMLRNEKRPVEQVREQIRARLSNADEVSTTQTIGEEARKQIILDAYRTILRREPTDDASSYWEGQMIELEIKGEGSNLKAWFGEKLASVEEARALRLVDEVYQQVKGADLSSKRTDLHERAVVKLRDEKLSSDHVREWVRVQLTELPKTGNRFLDKFAAQAVEAMRETGVPASLTLAQAMLESNSGASGLSAKYNNFFGIKGSGSGGSASLLTTEYRNGKAYKVYQDFAVYKTVEDSFIAHGQLIAGTGKWKPHYAKPWSEFQQHHDAIKLAQGIARIYATDPKYAQKVVGIMREYELLRFDQYV